MENNQILGKSIGRTLKIGIDLDDVVFEFVKTLISHYKEITGKDFDFENMKSYKFSDIIDLEHDEIVKLIGDMTEKNKTLDMDLCEFAKESIFELAESSEVYFITSRVHRKNTEESLKRHFSEINFDLHFSSNPYVNNEGKHKGEICLDLGIDYMVEDSPEHALKCSESGVKCFLIEKPWNKHRSDLPEEIIRVKNWKEIVEKLEELK